ncbi:MAG: hypothetical protein GY795_49680 [Desulfobacterales bacterium]|nr:hypothetical protein [Desulfobacterales bacterium]
MGKCRRAAKWANAAERQSDKAWGFQPQVGIVVNFCALKGRREILFSAPLQGANGHFHNLGFSTPGFYHFAALRHLELGTSAT